MATQIITISVDSADLAMLKEKGLSPTKVFRQACSRLRLKEVDLVDDQFDFNALINEIVRLKVLIKEVTRENAIRRVESLKQTGTNPSNAQGGTR